MIWFKGQKKFLQKKQNKGKWSDLKVKTCVLYDCTVDYLYFFIFGVVMYLKV